MGWVREEMEWGTFVVEVANTLTTELVYMSHAINGNSYCIHEM